MEGSFQVVNGMLYSFVDINKGGMTQQRFHQFKVSLFAGMIERTLFIYKNSQSFFSFDGAYGNHNESHFLLDREWSKKECAWLCSGKM